MNAGDILEMISTGVIVVGAAIATAGLVTLVMDWKKERQRGTVSTSIPPPDGGD
jgi:hypothetical protein